MPTSAVLGFEEEGKGDRLCLFTHYDPVMAFNLHLCCFCLKKKERKTIIQGQDSAKVYLLKQAFIVSQMPLEYHILQRKYYNQSVFSLTLKYFLRHCW